MKKILFTISIMIFLLSSIGVSAPIGADLLPSNNNQLIQSNPSSLFDITADKKDNLVTLTWTIPDDFYVYRDKVELVLHNSSDGTMQQSILPNGVIKNDQFLGSQEVYYKTFSTTVKIKGSIAEDAYIEAYFQGCNGQICLPVQIIDVAINKETTNSIAKLQQSIAPQSYSHSSTTIETPHDQPITQTPYVGYAGLILLFGLGLLLSFTPCVLPMYPILIGIILGKSKGSRISAFLLSLTYVLGMAITYSLLGLLVASVGAGFQSMLQTPVAIIIIAVIFVLLALSMFGVFNITLSGKGQSYLQGVQDKQSAGTYFGVFLMSIISAAVLSPCTSAPLIGVLTHVAESGSYIYGMLALFVLALGMGVPLIIIGTGFRSAIPKSGPWMLTIKHLFGFIMLGMAIWISSRIIPTMITQLLIAALIVVYAITNGGFDKAVDGGSKVKKSVLLLILLYGSSFFVSTLVRNKQILFPLEQANVNVTQNNTNDINNKPSDTITVTSVAEMKQEISKLRKNHTKILIDYYASWCSGCVAISKELASPKVSKYLKDNNIIMIKANVSEYGKTSDEMLKYFNVFGMPTLILTDNHEHEITRESGEMSQDKLIELVSK